MCSGLRASSAAAIAGKRHARGARVPSAEPLIVRGGPFSRWVDRGTFLRLVQARGFKHLTYRAPCAARKQRELKESLIKGMGGTDLMAGYMALNCNAGQEMVTRVPE